VTTWDEWFRNGDYPRDPEPSPVLQGYADELPDGRALDVATGTGRNAVFLAEEGYAVDQSRAGPEVTRDRAAGRGVAGRLSLVRADVPSFAFPKDRYQVVTVSSYRAVDRFPDLKASLVDGGCSSQQNCSSPACQASPDGVSARVQAR